VEVSEQDLTKATEDLEKAETARDQAREQVRLAAQRVMDAKQWVKFDGDRSRLARLIHEADTRAATAQRIRTDKARPMT